MKKVIVVILTLLLTGTMFAKVDFYGSARLGYWYQMMDEEMTGGESRIDMQFDRNSTSRLGMKFTADKLFSVAEFGFSNSVYLRLLYAKRDMGNYELLVGQDYTGFNLANASSQGTSLLLGYENLMIGYGTVYDGRHPMIKVIMDNGFYGSLESPEKMDPLNLGADAIDALIPKINLGYNYKTENFCVSPTFGFNMSQYNSDFNDSENDETVTAFVFATTFKYKMDDLELKSQINYGQNEADYGVISTTSAYASWDAEKGDVINSSTIGGYLQASYPFNFAKLTAGAGYVSSSADYLDDPDTGMSAFLQAAFKLHKNVSIIPEVGLIDNMEDGNDVDEGSFTYFGAKFQYDFSYSID